MRLLFQLFFCSLLFPSCAVFKSRDTRSALKVKREVARSHVFTKAFTGFMLLDPATGKTLADFNGDHYFTPGSNAKIFTLATCLEVLGDSVPGVFYQKTDTELHFRSIGDPTFLHPKFEAWQQIPKLLSEAPQKQLWWMEDPYVPALGPGWAWDDAPYDYSTERSGMPVFGNVSRVYAVRSDSLAIGKGNWHILKKFDPGYDQQIGNNSISWSDNMIIRYSDKDTFRADFEMFVPIRDVSSWEKGYPITGNLLESGLGRDVYPTGGLTIPRQNLKLLYSTPLDTVLRRMMHQSDNFIAEQMLLVCAGVKFDLLQQDTMIKWMLDSTLSSLPQRPRWVDGSGLSRYNLITPQSITQVLLKFWREQPRERLLSLFPAGGVSGTIEDWYAGKDGKPYVFAKTGSMGGVHCLSGYVVCRSRKTLIFSFMHNNFVGSSLAWKVEMQRILEEIQGRF